jgi:hypothetical protein
VRTDKLHPVSGHRGSVQQPLLHLRTPDLEEMAMLALNRRQTSEPDQAFRWQQSSTATMLHKRSYSPMSPVADTQETQVR